MKVRKAGERMKSSGIGGQAVIEGVMMKNKDTYAIAVRKPDGAIEVKKDNYKSLGEKYSFAKLPIIRGIVAFAESMTIGMKTLTYSASFYEEEEPEKPDKLEETINKFFKDKDKAESALMAVTVCASVIMAVGIFMILPFFIAEFFQKITDNTMLLALIEGALRIGIFIAYVAAISQMEDIKRVFMYHGAEHKTINCVESGKELTVANVKKCSKHHKRCGTSFMFIVMFVSIIFFLFIRVENVWVRMIFRILLIPIVAGVSYEFIRLAGNSDSPVVALLSKPGMWLQALTTKEPDDSMIEVAIASVEAVFDWKAYQKKEFAKDSKVASKKEKNISKGKRKKQPETVKPVESKEAVAKEKQVITEHISDVADTEKAVETIENVVKVEETPVQTEESATIGAIKAVKPVADREAARNARRERERQLASIESAVTRIGLPDDDDEDDEILKALDKFFVDKEDGKDTL